MQKSKMLYSIILSLGVVTGCVHGDRASAAAAAAVTEELTQAQTAPNAAQSFTAVEGADLAARMEAAIRRGRTGQTPFWSAYSFDVRPGVAIDPEINEFHGSMNTVGDTAVFVGTTASGMTVWWYLASVSRRQAAISISPVLVRPSSLTLASGTKQSPIASGS